MSLMWTRGNGLCPPLTEYVWHYWVMWPVTWVMPLFSSFPCESINFQVFRSQKPVHTAIAVSPNSQSPKTLQTQKFKFPSLSQCSVHTTVAIAVVRAPHMATLIAMENVIKIILGESVDCVCERIALSTAQPPLSLQRIHKHITARALHIPTAVPLTADRIPIRNNLTVTTEGIILQCLVGFSSQSHWNQQKILQLFGFVLKNCLESRNENENKENHPNNFFKYFSSSVSSSNQCRTYRSVLSSSAVHRQRWIERERLLDQIRARKRNKTRTIAGRNWWGIRFKTEIRLDEKIKPSMDFAQSE